jgi:hypothetical protein
LLNLLTLLLWNYRHFSNYKIKTTDTSDRRYDKEFSNQQSGDIKPLNVTISSTRPTIKIYWNLLEGEGRKGSGMHTDIGTTIQFIIYLCLVNSRLFPRVFQSQEEKKEKKASTIIQYHSMPRQTVSGDDINGACYIHRTQRAASVPNANSIL